MILENLHKFAETDRIAIYHGEETMSYAELFRTSQAIAQFLKEECNSNSPVAICGDKESLVVACMFAAVYAGKPYVVLPSTYPQNRLEYILEDCAADCLFNLSTLSFDNSLTTYSSEDISSFLNNYIDYPELDCSQLNPNDLAFIIYTSGSTGMPKGVEMTYKSLINSIAGWISYHPNYKTTRRNEACLASYGFIMSISLYSVLGESGSTWFSIPSPLVRNPKALLDYFISLQDSVNSFIITPTLAKMFLALPNFNEDILKSLRSLILGGEPLPKELAIELHKRFPNISLFNAYGATECGGNGFKCLIDDKSIASCSQYMPIGDISNPVALLVDENGNAITEEGIIGQIAFTAKSLSRGYHNNPELTAKHFVTIQNSTPAFLTGDKGYIKDGFYHLMGREDLQVKIGGNRVELQDIEHNLSSCQIVKECAVVAKKHQDESNSLTAFVILSDNYSDMKQIDAFLAIKKELLTKVESYKIPQKIIFIDSIPKNTSGKIDRKALQTMA